MCRDKVRGKPANVLVQSKGREDVEMQGFVRQGDFGGEVKQGEKWQGSKELVRENFLCL